MCGKCLSCKIIRRSIWAMRILHQYTMTPDSAFITLTYDDKSLMKSSRLIAYAGALYKHHLQSFLKRLRMRMVRDGLSDKLRYYGCGEYGDITLRPHYHVICFGLSLEYAVKSVNELWPHGSINEISLVNEARARYVAAYIDKKLFGEYGSKAYRDVEPPFQIWSKDIGIDFVVANPLEFLYDGCIKFGKSSVRLPGSYKKRLSDIMPDATLGMLDRLSETARVLELDWILDKFPEFGGRAYAQLSEAERMQIAEFIHTRSRAKYDDLVSGIKSRSN